MNVHADKEGNLWHAQGAHFLWHATFVALSLSRNYELNSHPQHPLPVERGPPCPRARPTATPYCGNI